MGWSVSATAPRGAVCVCAVDSSPTASEPDTNMLREARMVRRFFLAAVCLLLSVQLGLADEKTRGKISIWLGYPETLDAFKLGQAELKKKYPNVDVEILTFELREFTQDFLTWAQAPLKAAKTPEPAAAEWK